VPRAGGADGTGCSGTASETRSGPRDSRPVGPDGRERLRAAELAALTTTVTSSFAGLLG